MQTKIVKEPGRAMLVVDDPKVNAVFNADKNRPLRLMELSNCDIGNLKFPLWSLVDWRLTKYMPPNPYLSSSPGEWMHDATFEQMARVADLVPNHRVVGKDMVWSTFSGVVPGPHRVEDVINPNSSGVSDEQVIVHIDGGREGRWTFKQGLALLTEAKNVWAAASIISNESMNAMRIPNLRLQVSESDVQNVLRAEEAKGVLSVIDWEKILADKVKPGR